MGIAYGTATALPSQSNLNSLTNQSFANLGTIDLGGAHDAVVDVTIADVSESGNKQALIYAVGTVDGTNFADATQVVNLRPIGTLALVGTGPFKSQPMFIGPAWGGPPPPKVQIVVMNDAGVTFASSGNTAQSRTVTYS